MKRERPRQRPELRDEPPPPEPRELIDKSTPPDVTNVRAKSSGHRKRTADKWNQ
jgi:hypothetical protein